MIGTRIQNLIVNRCSKSWPSSVFYGKCPGNSHRGCGGHIRIELEHDPDLGWIVRWVCQYGHSSPPEVIAGHNELAVRDLDE